jgi:periplasmic protein TonB
MFADSLLETSWAHRSRRSWMTVTSLGLQSAVVGLLLLVPILTTVQRPPTPTVSTPITMGRRDPGPTRPLDGSPHPAIDIVAVTGRILMPSRMPRTIPPGDDNPTPLPTVGGGEGGGMIGIGNGDPSGLRLPLGGNRPMPAAPTPTPAVRPFRTSTMLQGSLIRRVEPVYPPLARAAHIQGPVLLAAVISQDGSIKDLRTVSGHPMLVPAAISAVSQWRYRPYILNGEAIEVETRITVNFILGAGGS